MKNDKAGEERREARREAPPPGRLATMALRAVDACMAALQRLRGRLAPEEEEGEARRGGGRPAHGAAEPPPAAEAPPRRGNRLRRALVVVLCLLLGAVAGMGFSFRELSAVLDARQAAVERMQEEVDQSKKQEARNRHLLDRLQKEKAEMRMELREARQEVEGYEGRVGELEKQLAAAKRPERVDRADRAARSAPAASYSTARPRGAARTGTCAVGGGTASGDLTECLERFNRP